MMISPEVYVEMLKDYSLEELIEERDELIEEMKALEEKVFSGDRTSEEWQIVPTPEVRYQESLEYVAEICKLLHEKYNKEIVWGNEGLT
ncbi:MAG: hypothetical protein K6G64_02955 [Eubacterium sp.]|nr:hypothetical protein [Eubacterium sp.]